MFILQFLELIVDDFNFWPTEVLLDIFIRVPTFQAIERVASFAYGNGVPLRILSRFLRLCGQDWSENSFTHLYSLYHKWRVEFGEVHHASYYNVKHKRFCWINGEDHNQNEFVLNGEGGSKYGCPAWFRRHWLRGGDCSEIKLDTVRGIRIRLISIRERGNNKDLCLFL